MLQLVRDSMKGGTPYRYSADPTATELCIKNNFENEFVEDECGCYSETKNVTVIRRTIVDCTACGGNRTETQRVDDKYINNLPICLQHLITENPPG